MCQCSSGISWLERQETSEGEEKLRRCNSTSFLSNSQATDESSCSFPSSFFPSLSSSFILILSLRLIQSSHSFEKKFFFAECLHIEFLSSPF